MKKLLALLVVMSLSMVGCSTVKDNAGKKTAYGSGIGAVVGAGLGALVGKKGDKGKAAAVGAVLGGLAGGAYGLTLDKQAKELERIAETRRTEKGIVTKLKGDITFATGKSAVNADAQARISQIAAIIKKYPEDILTIKGYTDSTGSYNTNQQLSSLRAQSVKSLLINGGVPANSISIVGMGPSEPIAENTTAAGRAQNRRVEIEIAIDESKIQKK